jgi:protein-S-isoprenylcysteine O-methyltransferase Ste14
MKTKDDPRAQADQTNNPRGIKRWVVITVIYLIIMSASLFLSAGTFDWTLAWIYISVAAGIVVLDALVLIPISPDLLGERSRYQKGAKTWDEFLLRWMATFGPLTIWIVSGLDFRNYWSDNLPFWVIAVSIGFVFLGGILALWAMAANRFFVGMVRIQTERGHKVISSGPYRIVRHPGYLGSIFYILFTPLVLGSLWGLVPALITVGVIILRTYLEDKTLVNELHGYLEYSDQVRFRIIPGIW